MCQKKRILKLGMAAGMVMMAGCQSTPARNGFDTSFVDAELATVKSQAEAAKQQEATLPPAAITTALLPPVNIQFNESAIRDFDQRFDIAVNEADAKSFFMSLVKDTPYNMVVHPSVTGTVSLRLKNVSIAEVMETVRNVYGFEYRRQENGFEVLESHLRSRLYKINYLNLKRRGDSQIRVSSGQVTETSNGSAGGDSGDKSGASSKTTLSGSRVDTASESDFWTELKDALETLIGEAEGRKVVINPQSGIIIVRAMPNELRVIEDYLDATQSIIRRQVILEAKILEVKLSEGFQAGINWAALGRDGDKSALFGQTGGGSVFNGPGTSEISGNQGVLDPNVLSMVQGTNASAFGGVFSLAVDAGDFTAFIELLEGQGDVHVLSSPRISTVNNQKAVIKVGQDEFFVTDVSTETNSTSTGAALNQSVNLELTPFFSGVALDVIPQIDEHDEVTLHIHPSVSEVTEKIKQINITTTDQLTVPLALSTIRESDSIVRARSGQVVVIGGLMQNSVQDNQASVPLLGSLPLIGSLFRHEKKTSVKSELVILLKPVVVKDAGTWSELIGSAATSLNRMEGKQ